MTTSHPEIATFRIALSLSRGHIEVLKAIGEAGPARAKEVLMPEARRDMPASGNMVFVYGAFKALRRMGLTRASTENRRNNWHLTTVGAQVYEQLFNATPNLQENEDEQTKVRGARPRHD
jgi:hypothetical protein